MENWAECFICIYTKKIEDFAHVGLVNICKKCLSEFPYTRGLALKKLEEAEAKIAKLEESHGQS